MGDQGAALEDQEISHRTIVRLLTLQGKEEFSRRHPGTSFAGMTDRELAYHRGNRVLFLGTQIGPK